LTWQIGFMLTVLAAMIVGLVRFPNVADVIFLSALALFTLVGIITPAEAFAGFSNEGMLTVGALFVVAAGLVETGVIGRMTHRLLGPVTTAGGALRRIVPSVAGLSAFLNNTAVVAMAMPVLIDWARRRRISASKLLLPLSYAAIFGGICTLIGTSTNLVVHGMLISAGLPGFGMWELGQAGIPIAVAAGVTLLLVGPRLLPERKEFLEQLGEARREFLVEMLVGNECPLTGRTVQEADLRHLPGLFLVEIERGGRTIAPVAPDEVLQTGDRLVFVGIVSTIVDLQKIPGFLPAENAVPDPSRIVPSPESDIAAMGGMAAALSGHAPDLGTLSRLSGGANLCEAVISPTSPLVGRGIREANFRTIYDAAVIAVHRNAERLRKKIGDIVLRPGDTLLLLTGPGFVRAHRNNPDFYLVSEAGDVAPPRHRKSPLAAAIAGAMVVLMTLPDVFAAMGWGGAAAGWFGRNRVVFVFLAAGGMVVTRCVSSSYARRSIDWSVLLVIAAAFGISAAMRNSGVADLLAGLISSVTDLFGVLALLAAVYLLTSLMTELMSNNAAAALMFPIAMAASHKLGVDPRPFAVAVAFAASASFVLPIGYQTNLMIFGPGGYRSSDFIKIGLPMNLLWFLLAMLLIPIFWPLTVR
jgi:di/tricarboxylate transporter